MTNLQLTIWTVVSVLLALFWARRVRKKERVFWISLAVINSALTVFRAAVGIAT